MLMSVAMLAATLWMTRARRGRCRGPRTRMADACISGRGTRLMSLDRPLVSLNGSHAFHTWFAH
jgi:hypothetical protein